MEVETKGEEMVNNTASQPPTPFQTVPLTPPPSPVEVTIQDDIDGWLATRASTIRVREKHQCLEPLEDWFYTDHFHRLMKILYTPRLIPAVQCLLRLHHMVESDQHVECVTQTVLHELKGSRKITDTIFDMTCMLLKWTKYKI
ncbi:hypothetical protein L3Q82_015342 [Scortum barcoo]|uniref:Uncharacterized protein n=1 Tax=Scortum barcoo TaxID=214431 RepID=A0ACB8VU09_9TELE|nr:hypothetical protein L3Q82_015342 [Scortum barcoo]